MFAIYIIMATLQDIDAVVVCVCVVFLDELARLLTNGAFFVLDDFRTVFHQQRCGSGSEMVVRAN